MTLETAGQFTGRTSRGLLAGGLACVVAWLVPASTALAFSEPVTGGTTTLTLELPKKISATPGAPATANGNSIVFQNSSGVGDAARGTARLDLGGTVELKAKRGKVDISGLKLNVGPAGTINASVKGEQMVFATVSGSQLQAGSFQATVSGASALITAEGAKKLNRALGKKKKKGKGKAVGARASKKKFKKIFREDDRIGTVSAVAGLRTVPVQAQGNMLLVPALGTGLTFNSKGISLIPGSGGIDPVPPATTAGIPPVDFSFPVSGGRISPDFSLGQLATAGGLEITKTNGVNGACDAQKPVGTFIRQTDLILDFEKKALLSTIDSTGGFVGAGIITADLDTAGATMSVSPSGAISIQDLGIILTGISATTLNGVFGSQAQGCGQDFQAGDSLGDVDVTAQTG